MCSDISSLFHKSNTEESNERRKGGERNRRSKSNDVEKRRIAKRKERERERKENRYIPIREITPSDFRKILSCFVLLESKKEIPPGAWFDEQGVE